MYLITTNYCTLCNMRVTINHNANIKTQLCESCLEDHVSGQMRDFIRTDQKR